MVSFSLFSSPTKHFCKNSIPFSQLKLQPWKFYLQKKKKIHFDINLYKLYFLKVSNEFFVKSEL